MSTKANPKSTAGKSTASTATKSAPSKDAAKAQTSSQPTNTDATQKQLDANPVKTDVSTKPGEEPRKPLQTETAEQKQAVKVEMPTVDKKQKTAVAKQARTENKQIVEGLTDAKTVKKLAGDIAREIRPTMPEVQGSMKDKEFESLIEEEIKKEYPDILKNRSTDVMAVSRIKTDIKTRIGDIRKAAQDKSGGSKKLKAAKASVATSAKSPLPLSNEDALTVAEAVPDFDTPEHRKMVAREQERISHLTNGTVGEHRKLVPERMYHVRKKVTPEQQAKDPSASVETFVGRLTEKPNFGKAVFSVSKDGKENGSRKTIDPKSYDIREISTNEAYDLSRVA